MLVIGIDPGSRATGYGLIEEIGGRLYCREAGVIRLDSGSPLEVRLVTLYEEMTAVFARFKPEAVSVEKIFTAKNSVSALKLGHVRGVILLAAAKNGIPIHEYTPLEIKQSVTGYGRSEKFQVQEMIKTILRLDRKAALDASDALAAAFCHIMSGRTKAIYDRALEREGILKR